jgi:hypothetical protein
MRGVALYGAVGAIAVALPIGLVSAAGHVSSAEMALPAELLQLVTPHAPRPAHRRPASVPRHASAWPTQTTRGVAARPRPAARAVARAVVEAVPAPSVRVAASPRPGPAHARPEAPEQDASPAGGPVTAVAAPAPALPSVPSVPVAAPPVAAAATAEPAPIALVPAATTPAPVAAPAAPVAPVAAVPRERWHDDEHVHEEHHEGD